ncbi:MAG: fibronectin type III domain-containing protein [Planctomycetes bacterium]|jgi:hypothetical protein|nr:fibronectin type III domain-containing protein [Planctomycetota bacterium]
MGKKIFLASALVALVLGAAFAGRVMAQNYYDGQVVKMDGLDTLYYVADGKRYVFPNEKTYKTWFLDFTGIVTLQPSQIYALPLAGNIRYRPGVLMIKITTDPKVYAVSRNGILRHVTTEALARKLYGQSWNLLVDDVPDSFFTNYSVGDPIDNTEDYDAAGETEDTDSIEANRGLALGHAKKAQTAKCRAIPAVPATPGGHGQGATPATPAVSARECKVQQGNNNGAEPDTEEPVISNVAVTTATSTATVSWKTDELTTGLVKYAFESLATATTSAILIVSSAATTTDHSLGLTGLTASTTYFYKIWSTDLATNSTSSPEATFTTLTE